MKSVSHSLDDAFFKDFHFSWSEEGGAPPASFLGEMQGSKYSIPVFCTTAYFSTTHPNWLTFPAYGILKGPFLALVNYQIAPQYSTLSVEPGMNREIDILVKLTAVK